MSKRSQVKHITTASRALKFLREQSGLSVRSAGRSSGVNDSVINHLENGRIQIHPRHLEKLLPAYGATQKTYEMFSLGTVSMPQNIRGDCLEIIQKMSPEQLRTAHPVLLSLSNHK